MNKVMIALSLVIGLSSACLAQNDQFGIVKGLVGQWEYRANPNQKGIRLSGQYDILRPAGQVRCLLGPQNKVCKLMVLSDITGKTTELSLPKASSGNWESPKNMPSITALIKPLSIPQDFRDMTRPGGSRDIAACGGLLPLQTPVCGETIDIDNFQVRWALPHVSGNTVSIILEKVDGNAALIRRTALTEKGEYSDPSLKDFFLQIQEPSNPVAVVLRIAGPAGLDAVRLIQVPSAAQTRKVQNRFQDTNNDEELLGAINRMNAAIDEGMWSRAGEEGRRIREMVPTGSEFYRYALAGVCHSGLSEEKSRLRELMSPETYNDICKISSPDIPSPQIDALASGAKRLGIALLIGNSSYWNVPLNSVDNDIQNLSKALAAVGFEVSIRKNLKEPKNFRDALEDVIREKKAGPDDVLLVYYSGHGIEIEGKTYLLDTGLQAAERYGEEIRLHAQSAEELLALMERKDPSTRILMVEACRNNLVLDGTKASDVSKRNGFAFNRAGVVNTYVMFANRPGRSTPSRSEYGLMGPFTESFIEALRTTSGEIKEVFETAKKNTMQISPGQEPVLETSDKIEPLILRGKTGAVLSNRAAELLNSAERYYLNRDWAPFMETMERARTLAMSGPLYDRLDVEIKFSHNVMAAEDEMNKGQWTEAAANWLKAANLFPARRWVLLNAALALTLTDKIEDSIPILRKLSVGEDGDVKEKSSKLLKELLAAIPELRQLESADLEVSTPSKSIEFEKVAERE